MLRFGLRKVVRCFDDVNVEVCGLPGRGKDMLLANVIFRRHQPYISNSDYKCNGCQFVKLNIEDLNTHNTLDNFISGNFVPYHYPYPEKVDLYISDAGVYFPAQDFTYLNRKYSYIPMFMALSRHIGDCRVHTNVQNLNRLWDKIREMSDMFILCKSCKVFFGKIVILRCNIYDKYQSCLDRVAPFRPLRIPLLCNSEARAQYRTHNDLLRAKYQNEYGKIDPYTFIFINRSDYDTRLFKTLLEGTTDEESDDSDEVASDG